MIATVFFDLYETLITEWENGERKAVYSTDKLGIDPEIYAKEWKKQKELQMVGQYGSYRHALQNMLDSLDVSTEGEILNALEREREAGKAASFEKIDTRILSVLKSLKHMGLKLGLISNCTHEDITAWESCALAPFFDDVFFSFKEGLSKPDPKVYQLVCQRLKSEPDQSLFIGDGGSNELYGARAYGLNACQATWFIPKEFRDRAFPQLTSPDQILGLINK